MLKMCLLLFTYAIAPIVAGHGILPMAWLLIQSPTWGTALAWGAILVIFAGSILPRTRAPAQLVTQLAGTLMLYGAWLANIHNALQFNAQAEQRMALESMLVFSLPLQAMTAAVIYLLAVQLKRVLFQGSTRDSNT